jgi:hypothetical protein
MILHTIELVGPQDWGNYRDRWDLTNTAMVIDQFKVSVILIGPVSYEVSLSMLVGSQVHRSLRIDNYGEAYGPGDVIGCLIHLDDNEDLNQISFYKNGVNQGIAYSGKEIPSAVYFPAISIYNQVGCWQLEFFIMES